MPNKESELTERLFQNVCKGRTKLNTSEPVTIKGNKVKLPLDSGIKVIVPEEDRDNKHQSDYEMVNHPQHYNNYDIEVIDMMERIWGVEATLLFCQMNAFKYRQRMGTKPGQTIFQDLDKEKWYLDKAKELKKKLNK